jgi:hypothetical protein
MNETAPVQKQDIDRVLSVLNALLYQFKEFRADWAWVHRDDPRPLPPKESAE